jgi:hypothetical protein
VSNAYTEHATDLAILQTELGDECPCIFYGGRLIKVLAGGVRNANANSLGGQSLDANFSGTFTIEQFTTPPKPDEIFKYPNAEGKRYKIDSIIYAAGRKQFRITAIDAAQSL